MSAPMISLGAAGLMTDPSAIGARDGLRLAINVIIQRPGVIEPRPGLGLASTRNATSQRPRSIHVYGTTPVVSTWDGGVGTTWQMETSAATITGGGAEPVNYLTGFVQFAEARRNLYWCSKTGVFKITASNDTTADSAGMHEANGGYFSLLGSTTVLANNTAAAWRWVFRKIDSNGVETRSAPSPWFAYDNTTGGTVDLSFLIPLPTYVAAGDQIELYRSIAVATGSTPSDQLYLATRYTVTSSDVSAGSTTVSDLTLAADLGQELYTNATREGALKSNGRPPACRALATWKRCMWFGGTIGPWTTILDFKTTHANNAADGTAGFGSYRYTAVNATSGSPTITGFASTNSIAIGQLITDDAVPGASNGTIPAGTFVLSKTVNTVTMTANAAATTAVDVRAFDVVQFGSEKYYPSSTTGIAVASYPTFAVSTDEAGTAEQLAYVIGLNSNTYYAAAIRDATVPVGWRVTATAKASLVVRSVSLSDAIWATTVVCATTGAVTSRLNSSGGILVERDDRPNRVYYSKPDEPEHVPEGVNWIELGSETEPVLALVALRGALLVFKRDGIFAITGSAPDSWRAEPLDLTRKILRGDMVSTIDNAAVAWTTSGVVMVDEGGATNISDGAIGRELQPRLDHYYVTSLTTGYFVACNQRRNLILVGAPTGNGAERASYLYAFCTITRAWTRWDWAAYCGADGDAISGDFYLARYSEDGVWELRKPSFSDPAAPSFTGYDRSYSLSAWTYASASITVTTAQRGAWLPKADDWVSGTVNGSTEYRRITGVALSGSDYVCTLASAFSGTPSADRVAYEGIVSKVQWNAQAPRLGHTALTGRAHVLLDWSQYAGSVGGTFARWLVGGQTDVARTLTTVECAAELRAAKVFPLDVMQKRELVRAAMFFPYLETSDIGLDWRLLGLALEVEGEVSARANR